MKVRSKINKGSSASSNRTPFFQKKEAGSEPGRAAFFQPLSKSGPIIQKEEGDQKQKQKEDNEALTEGLKIVGENLMSNNPDFKKWMEPRLELMKKYAWTDQPLSYKVGVISYGLTNLAILGGTFAADPQFRAQSIDFMQDKNLAAPLGLIPYSEYFPLSSFKYKLPSEENDAYKFDAKFVLTPWWSLLRSRFSFLPEASLGFGLSSAYDPGKGSFGVTGGQFSVGLFGGGLKLSGGTFSELSPYPMFIPGTLPGEDPAMLMKSVPGPPSIKLPEQDFRFMLSLDLMKF
jgi:hypothetical protein